MFAARHPLAPRARQRGAALIVMLVIMILGAITIFVSSLNSSSLNIERDKVTADALAKAKDALIGYAITYSDSHPGQPAGYLPCPDPNGTIGVNGEGSSETCGSINANAVGRLPWKTLGLETLRDGSSECLWYAVSGSYKNNPASINLMNWDNPAQLRVFSSDGTTEIEPGEIVAVVVAPRTVITTNSPVQDRAGTTAPICGGNYTATAYLDNDTVHGINNSNIATGKFILPHVDRDPANPNKIIAEVNDQIIYITRKDIWTAIQLRVANDTKKCLDDYAATSSGKYPWAALVSDNTPAPNRPGNPPTLFGRVPELINTNSTAGTPNAAAQTLSAALTSLQSAIAAFFADPANATNQTILQNASNLVISLKNSVAGVSSNTIDNAGDSGLIYANNPTASNYSTAIADLNAAVAALAPMLSPPPSPDGTMKGAWPVSCTLFSSATWGQWRDLVFYQVANGYQPGSTPGCISCLSIAGSGNTWGGNGTYRAAVIVAGKKLPNQARPANANLFPPNDYLSNTISEIDISGIVNSHTSANAPATTFVSYKPSDPKYQTVNDLVLCVDGKVNCK